MYSLVKKRKLGSSAIPANLTTLSVSWLNNQFKAVAVHRGTIDAAWERQGDTDGLDRFDAFIREAVQRTGYRGQTVSLTLAHPRLVQQLVDVPPVKGAALQKVIHRQAQQQKMFTGEAAWASQTSPSGKSTHRIVLHLFPRLLLNHFLQGCKRNGLHLTSVLPPSAVLQQQLAELPLDNDDIGLVAAETGGSTTLVAGRRDGQILLARTLPDSWNLETERLAVDINRTVLFINQQYGVTLNRGLWLFGSGAEEQSDAIQAHVHLPIDLSPVAHDPFYWATEALKLRAELAPNFISREMRQAPQRRVFATVVGAATGLMLAISVLCSAYFLRQARQEQANIATLSKDMARLETRRAELWAIDRELSRKKQIIKLITGDRPPPTPTWLLAYLGEAVPPDLVVTNFHVVRKDDYYTVHLAGTSQPSVQQPAVPPGSNSLAVLKTKLSGAPFYLKIIEEDAEKPRAQIAPPKPGPIDTTIPGWLSRVSSALTAKPAAAKAVPLDHFVIDGVMR